MAVQCDGGVLGRTRENLSLGLFTVNAELAAPDGLRRAAQGAEAAGFRSLWSGEHVVLPDPRVPPSPLDPDFPILDPVAALSFVAAVTSKLRLGTGVIVLAQRNPLVLAKQLATLDVLSAGRLICGFGVGYLEPELRAIGVPMPERGARADEYLAAMLTVWNQSPASFQGRYVAFEGVTSRPRPVQSPHPPLVIGGMSEAAHQRAVRVAQAWYGFNLTLDETAEHVARLAAILRSEVRPAALGRLGIIIPPRGRIGRDAAGEFARLGVDELVLQAPRGGGCEEILDFIRRTAEEVAGPQ